MRSQTWNVMVEAELCTVKMGNFAHWDQKTGVSPKPSQARFTYIPHPLRVLFPSRV
jgi:hypothetical protein